MGKRVLIVDDADFIRRIIRSILESIGYEVVGEAVNGFEAMTMMGKYTPDIIFMDITMPQMDGITSIREIRTHDKKVKIIVCSAMTQKSIVLDAIKAGADDFIEKPFREEKIIEVLKGLEDV